MASSIECRALPDKLAPYFVARPPAALRLGQPIVLAVACQSASLTTPNKQTNRIALLASPGKRNSANNVTSWPLAE